MPHFPMFTDLTGRQVLIVGDTPEARRKAEILAPFGAEIRLRPQLTEADLTPEPALVILTGENRAADTALCRSHHIPVNSADDPENCSFFFPALILRGDCAIGISSGGAAPAAAKALRSQIEAALPMNLEEILPWLSELTLRMRQQIPDYARRAQILSGICAESFQKNRPLNEDELAHYM